MRTTLLNTQAISPACARTITRVSFDTLVPRGRSVRRPSLATAWVLLYGRSVTRTFLA
jgi:hypothetical protein